MSNSESTSVGTSPLDFCDRPLSPVLCNARKNRPRSQLNKKNSKLKSRVNLSEKFKSKSESSTLKIASNVSQSSRLVSAATASERIRKLEQLERDRRSYYEILSKHGNGTNVLFKSDVAKKFEFKKPGSPISALKIKRNKGNQDGTISERYSPDKKISPPEMDTPIPQRDNKMSVEDEFISVLEAERKNEFLQSLEQENVIKNNIRACELKIKECSSHKSQKNDEVSPQNLVDTKSIETEEISEEITCCTKRKRIKEGPFSDENDLQIAKKSKQNMIRCIEDENRIEIALNNSISINIKCTSDQHFNIVNNKNVGTSKLEAVENLSPPNKKSPKKSPKKCGFSIVSGNAIKLKPDDLHKAQKMCESSLETEITPKKGKNEHKQKIIKVTTGNASNVGFVTANRQKILVSEQALKEARRKQQEAEIVQCKNPSPKKLPVKVKSESGTLLQIPGRALRNVISDMKECLNNFISPSFSSDKGSSTETKSEVIKSNKEPYWAPAGFTTASGKSKIVSEKFINKAKQIYKDVDQDISRCVETKPKESSVNTITLYKKDNHHESTGFKLAFGKSSKVSKNELEKSKLRYEDFEDEFSTTDSQNQTSENTFESSISGIREISSLESQPKVCEEVFDKAMQLYDQIKDYHRTDDKMKDSRVLTEAVRFFDTKIKNTQDHCKTNSASSGFTSAAGKAKTINNEHIEKYKDFFKENVEISPSNSQNSSYAKSTLQIGKCSSRKRLGMSGLTPISICKEQLEKARIRIDDDPKLSQDSKIFKVDFKIATPERKVKNMYSSTPIKSSITPNPKTKKKDEDNTLMNSTLTPIKHIQEDRKVRAECMGDSMFLADRKDVGPQDMHNELHLEYQKLKKKMEVICTRWEALDKQLKTLEVKEEKLKRYNPGQLYSVKSDVNRQDRIPLKSLRISRSKTSKITPKNALEINLVCKTNTEDLYVIKTTEDAIIIPTSDNVVGYPEFKNAFLAMPGVDPGLLPEDWFDNHLKWIVWKLASYDEKFGENYETSLTAENIISQLKYRYDKEICNARRPTLRKIFEKDEVPQKRMVLCVSDIIKDKETYQLELTDGWYSIRSIIDEPLTLQVLKGRILIGTKLIVQGSVLLNCKGHYPLEAPDSVRLKINYNNTRLAPWYAKLGYQKNAYPFVSTLRSVNPLGGVVGCLKLHLSRVYPLQYVETIGNTRVWRNEKAEENMLSEFENNYVKQMEQIQEKVLKDLQNEDYISSEDTDDKLTRKMYEQFQNDPESCSENLTKEQISKLAKFQEKLTRDHETEFSRRVSAMVGEIRTNQRQVKGVWKLLVLDASCNTSAHKTLTIWEPTEMHLDSLKEGESYLFYNVASTKFGELSSCSNTSFEIIKSQYQGPPRQIVTIPELFNNPKFAYNQFDLIGVIVKITINDHHQQVWVTDCSGKLLLVKIWQGPKYCSLLGGLSRGSVVLLSNLNYDAPSNGIAFADADNRSKISRNPTSKIQKEFLEQFKTKIENLENLLETCDINIEKYNEFCDVENCSRPSNSNQDLHGIGDNIDMSDFFNDSTDKALSLILF